MKKLLAILLLFALLPAGSFAETAAAHTLEIKNVPVYFEELSDDSSPDGMILLPAFPLYYADGVNDLPFVELSDFVGLVNSVDTADAREPFGALPEAKEDYAFRIDGDVFTCTYLPQRSDLIVDFGRGNITYTCMDTFGKNPAHSPFEIQTNPLDFLQRISDPRVGHLGEERTLSLSDYGIPMIAQEGKYLLPLHTAFDFLIWAPKVPNKVLCCNGAAIFIGARDTMFGYSDAPSELGNIYFSQQPVQRSAQLAQYGYGELCLMLDSFYGLKSSHHITSFRSFFRNNGYEERFLSADVAEADRALDDVIRFVLDDFHSNYVFSSWMAGLEEELNYDGAAFSFSVVQKNTEAFEKAFAENGLRKQDFYSESGNTAYVTLYAMNTTLNSDQFYSLDLENQNDIYAREAVGQILYAHRMINRENSPIENVVLDLSLNSGGDVNSAACALSWFLGEGYVTIANSFTGGLGITRYKADINRDHQFTEADSLRGRKKLFCLISPLTFSSANLTAAMLKTSGAVTMLGQPTKGGSGIVTPSVTGWDTIFNLSGFRTVATVKNGSWYDADTGVVPDVYISDPTVFYNRDKLTEIINALN